jgi:hypothetical protein
MAEVEEIVDEALVVATVTTLIEIMEVMAMVDVVIVEAAMEAVVVLAVEVVEDEMTRTMNVLSKKWIRIMILKRKMIRIRRTTVPPPREGQRVSCLNNLDADSKWYYYYAQLSCYGECDSTGIVFVKCDEYEL